MLQCMRKVNKDTAATIHQIITLPNNQLMGLQLDEQRWFQPNGGNTMIHMSSSQKQYKKSKHLEACKDMVESCKIPKWNCPHIWTASQLFAQLLNFGLLPQLLGSWPARTDPWCYEAWSCPRPTCASLWTWSHRIGAKEQQLGRKEPWVESSRPNSSSWSSERVGCLSLLANSSWLTYTWTCFDCNFLAAVWCRWILPHAVCCCIWMSTCVLVPILGVWSSYALWSGASLAKKCPCGPLLERFNKKPQFQ